MELITDFSYFNGIKSVNTDSSLQQSDGLNAGINSFDFPLDVKDYGEEPFLVGGKYGLYFVASGDVSENMVDFRVESGSIAGGIVFTGNGLTLSVTYTKMNDLSCARINQMAWNAAVTKWGANAKTNFGKLTKMYFNGFEGSFILKPYYRGTDDIITELNAKLSNNYVYCTSITSGIQFGGSIYMKKPIIINGNKVSMGISQQSFTVTNNTNDLDINVKFVPRFKTAIHHLINPTDCRIQELFGLNSIYGIMDRLTFKHTKHITHYGNSTATINVFFLGGYPIDTKVIQTLGSSVDLPAMDNSFTELYCNNTIRVNESSTTHLEVNGSNLDYINDQILIHLYDEDNVILPSESDYTNVDFIPPTCVFDFPMDEDDTATTINFYDGISLGRKTNGLITNLFIDCDNTANEGALQMYQRYSIYFTKLKYWVEQNSNDQAEYYNLCVINYATPMLRTLSTSAIVNEAIGVCSDNFIVIDGIPRGCNDTHYLTGTIFVKESTVTRTMHVYIGVRSLNSHVLNKITHYLDYSFSDYKTRGTMPYYGEGGYSDYGQILMTSDYTVFLSMGLKKSPVLTDYRTARKYNDDSSMLNSLKSISNQINSLEENIRIDMARGTNMSELWGNTILPYISEWILDTQTAITANDYEAIRENFSVIEVEVYTVGNVLQGTYKDTEYNIRFMTYPTFSSETSTSVNNISGIFIENKNARTVTGYHLQLTDFYSNFQNCVSKGIEYTRTFTTNVGFQEYYYNGVAVSSRIGVVNKLILKNVLYDIPLTNHNLIAPEDAFLFKPQTSDKYLATNDTALLKKNVQLHPMCKILTDSKGSEIGTIKVSSIMKMDFNFMQYYVDMSVRIQIMPSMYRNVWYFPDNLFELFKITIGMGSSVTSDVTYYPLDPAYHSGFLRENHPQVTYHVDNGILITNFRVLETSTCPFNFSNLMKITVNFSLKTNFYSSSPYRAFSYTFNLMDTITPKRETLQYCGSLFVPSCSVFDRVNTGVTATLFNGATNTYATNPFNNNNAGVVIKTKDGTGKTHILLRSSAESRKSVQYGTGSTLVMTTIYTVNDISSVLKMYPIIISRGVATGTIPTSYVSRLAYQNHKPVAANKPIIARTIIRGTSVKYYILNHNFGLIYSGSTNASMSNYHSYSTSSLYLGGDISVTSSNANYQICIKYASIDNFEELRCNNIDF